MVNSTALQNLAFAISSAGVDPADLIKRSDYQSEGEYYIALAKAAEALDNPNVRRALLRVRRAEHEKEIAAQRKAENEAIRELARTMKLDEKQQDEVTSRAAAQAAKEFAAGDLGKKTIAQRQRELSAQYEKEKKLNLATNAHMNQAIRDAWRAPTPADEEFVDRVVNRPVVDLDE